MPALRSQLPITGGVGGNPCSFLFSPLQYWSWSCRDLSLICGATRQVNFGLHEWITREPRDLPVVSDWKTSTPLIASATPSFGLSFSFFFILHLISFPSSSLRSSSVICHQTDGPEVASNFALDFSFLPCRADSTQVRHFGTWLCDTVLPCGGGIYI